MVNKYLIFPYENHMESVLKNVSCRIHGQVEELLTLNGWWTRTKSLMIIGDRLIKIKTNLEDVSEACNCLWIVESYYPVDFVSEILPVLIFARNRKWTVYYGRKASKEEIKLIRQIIDEDKLHLYENHQQGVEETKRLHDIRIPIIWMVDMFHDMPKTMVGTELSDIFQGYGYSVEFIFGRKDIPLVTDISGLPDVGNCYEFSRLIRMYNCYFENLEKEKPRDMFLVEIPGNLLEISKKVYGDFGMMAYIMRKAVPPDYVICNIPYMENILEKLDALVESVQVTMNIPIDMCNMIPFYLDLVASEQMEIFQYVQLSSEFIDDKIQNEDIWNINSKERARIASKTIIEQLKGYNA